MCCQAGSGPSPAPRRSAVALGGSSREGKGGYKHLLKQKTPGPLIPVQPIPAWSCTCILGAPLVPVGEASAASLLGAAGAASPVPPRPGEVTAKGLIPQLPSPGPCFTSRSPSTDQRALRFPLRSPKCSQRVTRCCQQPPAAGTGLSPPVTAASFSPPLPRAGGQVLGWVCGPSASLGTELLHRLPTAVPGFAVLPCPLLRHCRVSSCSALPAFACGWRVTALGTVVVTATVRELGRAMVRGPPGGHKALGRLLSLSVGENTVIRQKEGQ